jgi:hypothetical protein
MPGSVVWQDESACHGGGLPAKVPSMRALLAILTAAAGDFPHEKTAFISCKRACFGPGEHYSKSGYH